MSRKLFVVKNRVGEVTARIPVDDENAAHRVQAQVEANRGGSVDIENADENFVDLIGMDMATSRRRRP